MDGWWVSGDMQYLETVFVKQPPKKVFSQTSDSEACAAHYFTQVCVGDEILTLIFHIK